MIKCAALALFCFAACGGSNNNPGGFSNPGTSGGTQPGGAGANNTCTFSACGGDARGTWKFASSCVMIANGGASMACPSQTLHFDLAVQGMLALNPDMTYTSTASETENYQTNIPASCLAGIPDCSVLTSQFQQGLMMQLPPSTMVMAQPCTGTVATACTCTGTLSYPQASNSGTWSTSGNILSISAITMMGMTMPSQLGYCVQGNTLTFRGSTPGGTTITYTLTKN